MAAPITLGTDVAPGLIADAVNSTLNVVVASPTPAATLFTRHFGALTPPGVAGVTHVAYKALLPIFGALARTDGSAALGGSNPLRGIADDAWTEAFVQRLNSLGAFALNYKSPEQFVQKCVALAKEQPVYPAEFTITAADFPQNLTWVPGHFGALVNQPWVCNLQFQQFAPAPGDSLQELFMLAYECAPFYVRAQVIDASGPLQLVSDAYSSQMESYAGVRAGTMSAGLALATFPAFARVVALPEMLWLLPRDLSSLLRLFKQRCALATADAGSANSASAEDALCRQHMLALLWRFPLADKLLNGVVSSAEAYTLLDRIYSALPPELRASSTRPYGRLAAANGALNSDKVLSEVARTVDVTSRVEAIISFMRNAKEGDDAMRRSGGASAGDGSTPLGVSIGHGGIDAMPPAESTASALGRFSALRVQIETALNAKDYSLTWGLVASGDQLAPQQILFNMSKIYASDATFKSLAAQRSELPDYFGGELKSSLKAQNPGLVTADTEMLLDGFKLNSKAFTQLIGLKLSELNVYDSAVQELYDKVGGFNHRPRANWHLTLVDTDKMRQMAKSGHCLLRAAGFKDGAASQTADQLTYENFLDELISAVSLGSMIQDEDERLAHYEQIIDCYIEVMDHCSARAASLLRANPDKEALGYFIPSVVGCGPLNKMRGLHQHAAAGRNRRYASRPGTSEQYSTAEQPVSLVARKSVK